MLFNSDLFLFGFLPAVMLGLWLIPALRGARAMPVFIIAASLLFYGWWNWRFLGLLVGSACCNFVCARQLQRHRRTQNDGAGRALLTAGIVVNLSLLGYFKYASFFVDSVDAIFGWQWHIQRVALPLAISFFTFEQISYLVDTWRGSVCPHGFREYATFISFFPRLIAGPIVRPNEILPQIVRLHAFRFDSAEVSEGLFIFAIGLAKKVLIADAFGGWATPLFDTVSVVSFNDAWGAALAFVLQVYFDFSGYSDMAVGLALLFGIRLPENFDSPYQSRGVIEFWRRWHMTLSRFLRDYVYIPLGGNRHGIARQYAYLMITMTLCGLWHGANWTFVIFGVLQGMGLVINHAWTRAQRMLPGPLAWALTFLFIVTTFVFFRAPSFARVEVMLTGMLGANGLTLERAAHTIGGNRWKWLLAGLAVVLFCPNRQTIVAWPWRSDFAYAATFALLAGLSILALGDPTPFVYFQF